MLGPFEIAPGILEILQNRFNILHRFNLVSADRDWHNIRRDLAAVRKDSFHAHDKILVSHFDTDFYVPGFDVGIQIRNFATVITQLDISPSVFVFYTNHFGLACEFDRVFADTHAAQDRPLVIESFLSNIQYPFDEPLRLPDFEHDHIEHTAYCMMHLTRSHRCAVYRLLDDLPTQCMALQGNLPDT